MSSKLRVLSLLAALFVAGTMSSAAQAQVWNGYNSGFYGGLPYSVYSLDSVPYYALHPPVYYSHVVPRPYGYSPYAYPPGIMTPEVAPGESAPQVMINPHVPSRTKASQTENRVAAASPRQIEPKTILNPYVTSDVAKLPAETRRRGRPQPKTVRPTAMAQRAS